MKKICATFLCIFNFTILFADDFKLSDGKEYKGVTVSRVDPDGIAVVTDSGIEKIYFVNLPAEIQKKYGYDPAKAAAAIAEAQKKRMAAANDLSKPIQNPSKGGDPAEIMKKLVGSNLIHGLDELTPSALWIATCGYLAQSLVEKNANDSVSRACKRASHSMNCFSVSGSSIGVS